MSTDMDNRDPLMMDNKMWYIHIMEYYSALKRNGTLVCDTAWMNLENTISSKISQTKKNRYYMIPLL